MTHLNQILSFAQAHSALVAVAAVTVLATAVLASRAVRRLVRGRQAADVLTVVAAAVATSVVMNGMWRFAGNVLHFGGAERVTMFAFLELAMMTEAFRARRNIHESAARAEKARQEGEQPEPVTAGVDGIAVWGLSGLSAVLSSLDASSAAEAVARLSAPLVAAWLWERGLALYRRRLTGRGTIHWRFTLERILVRLGLAEPTGRNVTEVAAQRRLALLARAAKRLRVLRSADAAKWRQGFAARRLDAAMSAAVEHAGLASDEARQDALLAQMGALYGALALAELTPAAPWARREADADAAAQIAQARAEAAGRVQAAERARDAAIGAARQAAEAAEARARAAALDAAQARDDAARLRAASVTTTVQALGKSCAALQDRAEAAERELAGARTGLAEARTQLAEALARAERAPRTDAEPAARTARTRTQAAGRKDVDRDALVAELAAEILADDQAGREWKPEYGELMRRTHRSHRWCEYVVSDARTAAAADALGARTEASAAPAVAGPVAGASAEPAAAQDADSGAEPDGVIPVESAGRVPALAGAGGGR